MPYVPNPTQATEPVEGREIVTAAREFRELKGSVNTRISALTASAVRTPGSLPIDELPAAAERAGKLFVFDAAGMPAVAQFDPALDGGLRDDLAATTGATLVGFLQSGTGAVATTAQSKLLETVSVKDFGALGIADDTIAIQKALDTGADVIFPAAAYTITAPLQIGSQRLFGGVVGKGINRAQTIINIAGNHAAFVNKAGEISFEIDGFFINYGESVPNNVITDGNKSGFKFTTNTIWPAFTKISNCTVRGGWNCFYDDTGTYQTILERVFSWNCARGFFKQNGTTVTFDTCMAQGGRQGFYIKDTLSPTLINCAADQLTPGITENTANYFEGCRSLTIIGWDAESNVIAGNELSYMRFVQTTATISGFVGYLNTLNCSAGQEVYFIKADQGCRLHFSGCDIARNVGDLVFTGTGGNVATLLAYDTTSVSLTASEFLAATGGTPTVRYSLLTGVVSSIKYTQTAADANIVGATELADTESGSWAVGLNSYTTTGSPVLTGSYTRVGNQVTCFAVLDPNGGTIASTSGVSALSGLPFLPSITSVCSVSDAAVANVGLGLVTAGGLVYTPTWAASGVPKVVQLSYMV